MKYKFPAPSIEIAESESLGARLATDEAELTAARYNLARESLVENNNEERARDIIEGRVPSQRLTKQSMLAEMDDRISDIRLARPMHARNHADLLRKEEKRIKEAIRSDTDALAKKFASAFAEAFEALRAIESIQGTMIARGFDGGYGLFPVDTSLVFREGTHPTSYAAMLLKQCRERGFLKTLPEGVR